MTKFIIRFSLYTEDDNTYPYVNLNSKEEFDEYFGNYSVETNTIDFKVGELLELDDVEYIIDEIRIFIHDFDAKVEENVIARVYLKKVK